MVDLKIEKMCGCVKKAGLPEVQSFDTLDEALESANKLAKEMNENYCKKHTFSVAQNGENELVLIEVKLNEDRN